MVKSGCDFRDMTKVMITLPAEGGQASVNWPPLRIPVTGSYEKDASVQAAVQHFEEVVEHRMCQPIGVVDADLDARCATVRTGESALGNLVTDIFREVHNAQISILNGGCIRSDSKIPSGTITLKDMYTFFPFEDVVMLLKLEGRGILYCLENGVSRAPAQDGRFAHVSGLTFKYDINRPSKSRVVEVLVGGEPLDLDREYTLATNGFLSKGKEGYKSLAKAEHVIDEEFAVTVQACLADYFAKTRIPKSTEFRTLSPRVEGRVENVDSKAFGVQASLAGLVPDVATPVPTRKSPAAGNKRMSIA